jgi:hypothetical protein
VGFHGAEVVAALGDDVATVERLVFDEEAEAHDIALGDCLILIFDFEGNDAFAELAGWIGMKFSPVCVLDWEKHESSFPRRGSLRRFCLLEVLVLRH